MSKKRGRKTILDEKIFMDVVMQMKNNLVVDNKIVDRDADVWRDLAKNAGNKLAATSFFVMVHTNRYNVKDMLLGRQCPAPPETSDEDLHFDESNFVDLSYEANKSLDTSKEPLKFDFIIPKEDFENLIEFKYYEQFKNQRRNVQRRLWCVFRAGVYQDYFIKKIWETTHIKCGFIFKHSYVNMSQSSAKIAAYCKCGSKLTCDIQKCSDFNDYIVNCQIVNGIGKCGKPYLRNPIRKELGERMYGQHVEAFRSEQANEMMSRDGDPEAPMIRSASVLYNVKKEHLQQQYIRPNPLEALKILKYGELVNCIEDIGFDPFFVQYSTNDALQSYKKLCAKQTKTCVCIDSTAGVVKKLDTKTIFLHALAVGVPEGQFSVTHMLSEISHTQAICNWLKMWRRSGAPVPDACVTDWSKALLNGTTNAFTTFETVENYADSLNKRDLRTCKIFLRIDVAHTMKKYSQFFKTLRKPIKTFYLACIGQLIKCSSKLEARTIIENLLIVCQSETDGHLRGGNATACEDGRRVLMELITTEVDSIITEESESVSNIQETIEPISNLCKNSWSSWFDDIQSSVKELIAHQEGDRLNAYYFVPLVAYLLKDIPLLPLWTNIVANDLGFGGVNPSSAAIEQVFRKIKNDIFTTDELPMRVDMFVQKHTRYLLGKLKLVIAQMGIVDIADVNKIHVGDIESSKCEKSFLGNGNESSRSNLDYECENSNCPACRIDGLASGSHHCVMCTKAVHALDQCSIPYNEDGYSQQRVCFLCWENKDFSNNIALRDFDNWGNMGVINKKIDEKRKRKTSGEENKKSKRSLYLGEKKSVIKDIINIPKHKKIPIIKNGNDKTLCPIKLENKNVFLKNTCAFDSIFQLMLAAIHDYEELDQIVSHQEEQNSFYELLKHVKDHGLGSHSYQLRGRLLGALYKILESPIIPGAYYVNCEDNVGSTARQIFSDNHFSYTEVTICNNGCEVLKKSYVAYDVPITHLIKYKIEEIITKYTKLMRNGKCNNKNCLGDTVTEQYLGDVVIFDVLQTEKHFTVSLKTICPQFDIPGDTEHQLVLLGIVEYTNYNSKWSETQMGHYTAIARRRDGSWMRYDDLRNSDTKVAIRQKTNPALLVLAKIKK